MRRVTASWGFAALLLTCACSATKEDDGSAGAGQAPELASAPEKLTLNVFESGAWYPATLSSFGYEAGQLVHMDRSDWSEADGKWLPAGRLDWSWGPSGHCTMVAASSNGAPVTRRRFVWSADGRLQAVVLDKPDGSAWQETGQLTYGYDETGQLASVDFDQAGADQPVRRWIWERTSAGKVDHVDEMDLDEEPPRLEHRTAVVWDAQGRVAEISLATGQGAGQEPFVWSETKYTWNPEGTFGVEETAQRVDPKEQLVLNSRTSYSYDDEGRLVGQAVDGWNGTSWEPWFASETAWMDMALTTELARLRGSAMAGPEDAQWPTVLSTAATTFLGQIQLEDGL